MLLQSPSLVNIYSVVMLTSFATLCNFFLFELTGYVLNDDVGFLDMFYFFIQTHGCLQA